MYGLIVLITILLNSSHGNLWELIDRGRYREVIQITRALIDSGRVDREVLLARAFALRMEDSLKKAIEIYKEILKVNPDDYDALLGLALTLSWNDQLDSSISVYRRILSIYGEDKEAMMGIARVYGWKGDLKKARAWIKRTLNRFKDTDVYELCGEIYTWSDMYSRALKCYRKALKLSPQNSDIMVKIGNIYEWQGDYFKALVWYGKAVKVDSSPNALKGISRVKSLLRPLIHLKVMPAIEKDSLSRIKHLNGVASINRYISKYLDFRIRLGYHRTTFEGDSSRKLIVIQPGIVVKYTPFSLTVAPGFGATGVFYAGISMEKGPIEAQILYSEEILEEGKMIKLKHLELRGKVDVARFTMKIGYDHGDIAFDGNSRRVFDLNISRPLITRPVNVKILYSYGFKHYDEWSPYYYSPQDFNLHSAGVAFFKDFGRFYVYSDISRSFSGNPGMFSYSFEVGTGKIYISFSSFNTSENYSYMQMTLGYTGRIGGI